MEEGVQVWTYDPSSDDPWIMAEIVARTPASLTLRHLIGSSAGRKFERKLLPPSADDDGVRRYDGVEIANAPLSSMEIAEGVDNDMIGLPHLHEPAILHAVSERYFRGEIYTWTGPILIAINPFQRLPLYTKQILTRYRKDGVYRSLNPGDSSVKPLSPHAYSVADRSYRQMMKEQRKSQSILISGESGAGKTETTKIVMLYLTTLGSAQTQGPGKGTEGGEGNEHSIMERVLQINPILEAFGNAKTLRNDNSSRFGKFIELGFDEAGMLLGAKVQTYLLEMVRIGFHNEGERNYHIFYQLLVGSTEEQQERYRFLGEKARGGVDLKNYYHLTGQGGAPKLREFSDEEGLRDTLKSMESMGWSETKIDHILKIVAGILHLGEVKFESKLNEGGQEVSQIADEKTVADAAKLLGVNLEKLITALTVRIMVTRGEEIRIDLAPAQAADARDALAKTVYGAMFLWVVKEVNNCIKWKNDRDVVSSAGVLDIFGFESFAVNSFEQLCINFTNEALQQQFNKFIFKFEQEEYKKEKIRWEFIEFPDNQDCLDTIQARPKGLLAMLDDECKLGQRGNDMNWAKRLNETYLPQRNQEISDNTRYSATKMQQAKGIFCIRHFAGNVQYNAETNFLEKNRNEIPLTAKSLMEQDSSDLIKEIYAVQKDQTEDKGTSKRGGPSKQKTVSQQFKAQLTSLISLIETTDPHYIRCLKPNDEAKPKLMIRKRLTEQLRYGGVLEAVRVARIGYPVRLDHKAFFKRYRMLVPTKKKRTMSASIEKDDPQTACGKFLEILKEGANQTNDGSKSRLNRIRTALRKPEPLTFEDTDVQLGETKVFMRKGPHDKLESHLVFHKNAYIVFIQSWLRGVQQKNRYRKMGGAALAIQRCYRGHLGRIRWARLHREAQAGLLISNNFRMQIKKRGYKRARHGTVRFQALVRMHSARTKYEKQRRLAQDKENSKKAKNDPNVKKGKMRKFMSRKAVPEQELEPEQSRRSSCDSVQAEKVLEAVIVGHNVPPEEWDKHNKQLARLENQLKFANEEKDKLLHEMEEAEEANATARKRQRRMSWGMRISILVLVAAVAALAVMVSSSNSGDESDDASNLRGSMIEVQAPTASPSMSSRPSSSPVAELPIIEPDTLGTLSCPNTTKQFDFTVQLGQLPEALTWHIRDRCTLETYYSCEQCAATSPPNHPVSFAGCLPTVNNSTGNNIEYILQVEDGAGFEYEMRYGLIPFPPESTDGLQTTHFGIGGGGCSEPPSMSSVPTASAAPSQSPSTSQSPTAMPSWSPTRAPTPHPTNRPGCFPKRPGSLPLCGADDPRCIQTAAYCCCP